MTQRPIDCIDDTVHVLLVPLNEWLKSNQVERDLLLGLMTVICDGLFLYMMVDWVRNSKSWRLPLAIVIMLLCKEVSSVSF